MKLLKLAVIFLLLTPTLVFARSGEGSVGRYRISGFYGLASVSPSDVNNWGSAQTTTPKLNSLSSSTNYGGEFGIMVSPRFEIEFDYDVEDAKNPVNTTSPAISNAGIELQQNTVWGGGDFLIVDHGPVNAYVGALIGYPTYAHAIVTGTTNSYFDAARQLCYQGKAGLDFVFTRHFSVFIEGGYQFMQQGTLSNGNNLAYTGNSGVKMDLSGLRGQVGASIHF